MVSASASIPVGYKQTEVGVIPEDWQLNRLENFTSLITKGTTPTSLGKSFQKSGINFLKAESIAETGLIIPEKVAFIDGDTHQLLRRSQLSENDILISIAGVLGRIGRIQPSVLPANTNQALAIIRLSHTSMLSRDFLFHYLRSSAITKQIADINVQAAQANISLQNVGDFLIAFPLMTNEQHSISTALSNIDTQIQSLENLIAKKRHIKQGAMQELLTGKTRLPGFEKVWREIQLGSILSVMSGKDWKHVANETGKYPVLGTGGVMGWADDYLYDQPCVLIGRKGTIDKPQYMEEPFWSVDTLFYCIVNEHNFAKFVYYKFHQIDWYSFNEASGVPSLNSRTIGKITMKIPELEEQEAISEVLSDMDAEIAALEQRLEKTKAIKQGMMQQLLTGRIRLVDPSTPTEASA